ncbi:MAG: acyltransferase [Methylocystis sp.]|nr:acyltransferase [Methylocystis sp.]
MAWRQFPAEELALDSLRPPNAAHQSGAERIPGLDGLRGVAILLVLATHTRPALLESGFFGVDIFFALSGFLITTLLLRERKRTGSIDLRQFYLRRAARILPVMGAVILSVAALGCQVDNEKPVGIGHEALAAILFYLNWVHAFGGPVSCLVHLWSLSIEEQFYLIWPGVLLACLSRGKSDLLLGTVIAVGIMGPEIARILLWPGSWTNIHYYRTDLRVDALFWGALAAWAGARSSTLRAVIKKHSSSVAVLALAVLAFHTLFLTNPWERYYLSYGAYTAVAASSAVLIACVTFAAPRALVKILEFRPLQWIGMVSYGLYLWHPLVFLMVGRYVTHSALAKNALDLSLSLAVTAVSFYFWERPFLRLKRHFQPRLKKIARLANDADMQCQDTAAHEAGANNLESGCKREEAPVGCFDS